MTNWLTKTATLWTLFAAFLVLSLGMLSWILIHDLHIIDEVSDPEAVIEILRGQTFEQHRAHFWMTLIGDLPYPFAYGLLFAGLILRNFKTYGKYLAIPALLSLPADTIENISQLFILSGNLDGLAIKEIVTPIKLFCWIWGIIFALAALIKGGVQKHRANS